MGGNVSFLTEFPLRRDGTDLHSLLGPELGGLHRKPGQVCPAAQRQKSCQLCRVRLRSLWLRPAAPLPFFGEEAARYPGSYLFSLTGPGRM